MKSIPQPDLKDVKILTPAEMNKIHFAGIRSPLTPEQLTALAEGKSSEPGRKPKYA